MKKINITFSFRDETGDYSVKVFPFVIKCIVSVIVEFVVVEEMPVFRNGNADLMRYLSENIKYPTVSAEQGVQGRVVVQFVVGVHGEILNPVVVKSVDPYLDKEAIRVISSMPKWKPGKQRGKAVRVKYTVPVVFRLQS